MDVVISYQVVLIHFILEEQRTWPEEKPIVWLFIDQILHNIYKIYMYCIKYPVLML